MRNLPTDLLRTFVTVVDSGGFTAAAQQLGRSQPAISLQLKRLQDLVGQKLLARNGLPIELNSQGQLLYQYAKQILALNDQALAQFETTAIIGKIHFGIPSEFATTLLPKIVGRFVRAYPNITLEVTSALSKELLADQKRGQFDLILALHDDPASAGANLVKEEELVWVGNGRENLEQLPQLPLIVAPDGCVYRGRALRSLQASGQPWRVVYTNPDWSGITAAIDEGLGVTPLAKSTVPENLKILKAGGALPELGRVGVSLTRPRGRHTEATQLLADFVSASLTLTR
ncbi:LysR family transcriptional regulator [Halioxenophilus sp. WMMB6]|uniref:LysR family transcriptional regulator n=1 Tax=Halioxenophilus sp. WMMB6 TaxID=3073815 RepID=UPI00295EB394|nr:LysR family transcriptional regulator [Halioxenophilus sp. WMMB6]